jgi:phage regulator Rha-like protein
MTNLILTPQQISVSLEEKDGELRLDSRIVADGFGISNHTSYRTNVLLKYESAFTELGVILKMTLDNGEIVWYLNQDQANFAGTLARNTERAVNFKLNLVKAFSIAKQIIPVQNDRLRELDLELQLERERNKRIDRQDSMLAMHGRSVVLALNGCADAIVRDEIKVTEVINLDTGTTQKFLSADQLKIEVQKRTGQKVKSMKAFTDEIRKSGRDDLLVAVTRQATSEYVTPDRLDEAISIVYGKQRQKLIGE